jgi:hypothetical protein
MTESTGFFVREGGSYRPTGLGFSPWNKESIGGVPLAGLAVHLMEALPTPVPMQIARFTIDILGVVPMAPLEGEARIIRDGKRVQVLSAELHSGGRTWARASALRVRQEETPVSETPLAYPLPTDLSVIERNAFSDTVRIGINQPGRGGRWVNFLHPVVEGMPLSAVERAAMLSDFGSGISPLFSTKEWTFANLDITVYMARPPRGDWQLIDATTESAGNGIGLATTRLGDRDGMFGHSIQTLFLARR